MIHYKYVHNLTSSDVTTGYPHDPENYEASFLDYLEDQQSQGWELVTLFGIAGSASQKQLVFRAHGRNT